MTKIGFTKLSATGNDFILIDNRQKIMFGNEYDLIRKICSRRTGIGADGVLLIEESVENDFKMRYYNADGFEAEMCGNGARACAYYSDKNGIARSQMTFEVSGAHYSAHVDGAFISLLMQKPENLNLHPAALESTDFQEGGYLVLGVPHYVLFADRIQEIDVEKVGSYYCEHPEFKPRKTNVNFVSQQNGKIQIRTFERGVNEETLSCGTGTVSSAIILNMVRKKTYPMDFETAGGPLRVDFDVTSGRYLLQGTVTEVYTGSFQMENFS